MKETINSLRIIFSYVAWPPGNQKILADHLRSQQILQNPSVCVCVWWRTTLRRCDVEVSEKNTYLSVLKSFSLSSINYYISIKHTINWNLNIYSVQLLPRINNNTKKISHSQSIIPNYETKLISNNSISYNRRNLYSTGKAHGSPPVGSESGGAGQRD